MLNDGLTKEELGILLATEKQIEHPNKRLVSMLLSKLPFSPYIKKPSTSTKENERPTSPDA